MQIVIEARAVLFGAGVITVELLILSSFVVAVVSLVVGFARLSKFRLLRGVAVAYLELFRGTSLVVQLFWLFFVLPVFGITLAPFTVAVLGIGLCMGAYGSEVVRSAMLAVPKGHWEAGVSLGLSEFATVLRVQMPQALLIMTPSIGNLLVQVMKCTSVASLVTIPDLTFQVAALTNNVGPSPGLFLFILAAYFVISSFILYFTTFLEKRLSRYRTPDDLPEQIASTVLQ